MRRSNHKPEALGARRRSWNSPETHGAERRRSQKVKPWVSNQNPSSNPSQKTSPSLQLDQKPTQNNLWKQVCEGEASSGWGNVRNEACGGGAFKFSASTNRSIGSSIDRPHGQRSTVNFSKFSCIFLSRDLPHALFSWNPHFFYVQCHGNFDFWSKFDLFPMIISIWCIWYEFHAIIGYI